MLIVREPVKNDSRRLGPGAGRAFERREVVLDGINIELLTELFLGCFVNLVLLFTLPRLFRSIQNATLA